MRAPDGPGPAAGSAQRHRTDIFVASTLYGAANLAAAVDAGLFPDGPGIRRMLVISNNTPVPEITPAADELPGFAEPARRFDRVVSYNEVIRPFHPSGWLPRPSDAPLWQRYLRDLWDLGDDDVHLVVESIQVSPAQSICRIFADASIDVYADGLMSYGPTRVRLDALTGSRIERLLYADLIPGLVPLLLTEWSVRPVIIPTSRLIAVLDSIGADSGSVDLGGAPVAVLLGQYLAALGIMTAAEEEHLHLQMLDAAVASGHDRVLFKPHPHAPRGLHESLSRRAADHHIDLWVVTEPALVETVFSRLPVTLVIGCFSTALFTAATLYGIPASRVGTTMVLDRLSPYHNSNRIPVTLVDALLPPAGAAEPPRSRPYASASLRALVSAVGYVMQPQLLTDHRSVAEAFLTAYYVEQQQYFRRRRLTRLGLPGALPSTGPRPALARLGRRLRRLLPVTRRPAVVPRPRRPA